LPSGPSPPVDHWPSRGRLTAKPLATLVVNKLRGGSFKVAAVKVPGFGDAARPCWKTSLSSLAAVSSARDPGIKPRETQSLEDVRCAKKVRIDKDKYPHDHRRHWQEIFDIQACVAL